jgi:hypothetical protein
MPAVHALPCLTISLGCAAEQGIQISELSHDDVAIPITPPGSSPSSPTATDASGASGASTEAGADADAVPPILELDLQTACRLLDWAVAFFLCSSLAQLFFRRNTGAAISGCVSIVATIAHLCWRQQGGFGESSAEALKTAMIFMVRIPFYNMLVIAPMSAIIQ